MSERSHCRRGVFHWAASVALVCGVWPLLVLDAAVYGRAFVAEVLGTLGGRAYSWFAGGTGA